MSEIKNIVVQGLWKNNSALVQLLGLCPLLAVTSTATNALGLGLATTLVLTLTNLTVSTLRRWTPAEIRIPIYVMIIASVVSAVQMLINAYAFGLYQSLGIFIPLIVTNCIVVGRAEAFAARKGPWLSALDGFSIGMGATGAMFVLGSLREILGMERFSMALTVCWGAGRKHYGLRYFTPTRLFYWQCCRPARLSAWALCWQ